jgi:antitoxin HigA-1
MFDTRQVPVHPGEILLHEFVLPMNLTSHRLALCIGVDPRRIHDIVQGKRAVTADTALRLGRFFGVSPEIWMDLQTRYDLDVGAVKLGDRLDREVRPCPDTPA